MGKKYEISKENIEKIFDTKQIDRWIPYVAIEKVKKMIL